MPVDIQSASDRIFENAKAEFKFVCDMICMDHADKCDSNIELLFLAALEVFNVCYASNDKPNFLILQRNARQFDPSLADVIVIPQYTWNQYRIDFCLFSKLSYPIFIECDGHDFHERTKEQAEKDRSRDRTIQEAGIPVLRFTGRELYRDPVDCALQVAKFINARSLE